MPIHISQYFRNRELALEAAGLIVKLNSDGYNQIVAAENAGQRGKNQPVSTTFNFNNTSRTFTE